MATENTAPPHPVRLAEWRLWRNLTQRDLAQRAGLGLSTVNQIETGKRTARPATLRRLAAALDTEDWNLHNPPREDLGLRPQIAQLLDRLDRAVNTAMIGGLDGWGFARAYRYDADDDAAVALLASAGECLSFLLPFWRELGTLLESVADEDLRRTVTLMTRRLTSEWRRDGVLLTGGTGPDAPDRPR